MSKDLYPIDWEKYNKAKGSIYKCMNIQQNILRYFHTCEKMLEKKKQLEREVDLVNHSLLSTYFQTPYCNRKRNFYRKLLYEILIEYFSSSANEEINRISQLTKDILYIYDKKEEELELYSERIEYLEDEREINESYRNDN